MSVAQLMEDVLIGALTISVAMCVPVERGTISMMMIIIVMVSTLTHNIVTNSLISLSTAQPCVPQLTAPQNGSMWCTGDQVTDQNCSFACDAGFTFGGSELRECQSSNSWTGVDVTCTPKHCISLTDPPNGFVDIVVDCDTVLTTACEIKCVDGYYINDTTPFYQTCVANQTSGGVYWTTQPECECEYPNT